MILELLFWLGLIFSLGIGAVYFRDLGDVSQMVLKVKRRNMIRFIRNEYKFIGAGPDWLFWTALVLVAFLYGFPWVWVHLGLRNQAGKARAHPDYEMMRPHLAGNDEGLDGENVVMTYCAMAGVVRA